MPLHDRERGISLVAAARLDNRDELCDLFEIPIADRPTIPDGHLVMRAFQKWEEDCPEHLYGDWAYAAWDSSQRRLLLARDHLGITGLYYFYKPPLFAFASAPEALFASGKIQRQINEFKLARFITFFGREDDFETIFQDVQYLLPAHSLVVRPKGMEIRRYWRLEEFPSVRPMTDGECLEGFLHLYRGAVRSRLRSARPIGATLSSGLDSGSATVLTAETLRGEGKKLIAFTSVPLHSAEHLFPVERVDEWPLAHAIVEPFPHIEHIPIRAEAVTPIGGVKRVLSILRMPIQAAVNSFWIIAMLDEAKRFGLGVLITGQLGNGGISWSGGRDRIFTLLSRGDFDSAWKSLFAWKSRNGYSWFRTVKQHILRPLLSPIRSQRHRILHPFDPPWGKYAPIQPGFARKLGLRKAMRKSGYDARFSKLITPMKERKVALFRNGATVGPIWHAFGSAFGLEVRDPTADVRLIEFCMSVPDEQYVYEGGDRMLIRRAMEGLLPYEIQWNLRRGKQAADVTLRLLDHVEEMDLVLDRLSTSFSAANYLDIDAMRHAWDEVRANQTLVTKFRAENLLLRGIMTGLFLESLEQDST
jgi:asparagine synthase (glutamine-hydrolysing)